MINEGIIANDSKILVKSEMIKSLSKLGRTSPLDWEREVFRTLTGHEQTDVDWSVEDNHAGYYTWIKSFDQLIEELIDDGYARVSTEDGNGGTRAIEPIDTDTIPEFSQLVYPARN